ncbi:hypothetical protein HZH68_004973 [Vespula germanica]|uniref:CDT1 Geminin-binding domain-containing protein n=1 Tax=Vespula germanica TaxID=30212 RepID=A0A834NEZ0_VESGE|nr:hypothetical protein HZH68_004973 [Vespula germanica]
MVLKNLKYISLNKLNLKYQSVNKRTLNCQESITPIKNKLDKTPAYQRYLSLAESNIPGLLLPYNYRFPLCCLEEIIFKKLKPAVQELLRRNFTLEYLVEIKIVYPNAYIFHQEFIKVSLKLDKVKTEHEQFLLKLDEPIVILKEKIIRWHPEFDVEKRAKSLFHYNTRMEKALQRLAEAKMISKSKSPDVFSTNKPTNSIKNKVNIMVIDISLVIPTMEKSYFTKRFKGILKALEKVRAKQTAKALEMMTQTPDLDKEATLYSRLLELAKILHSIFVTEKKKEFYL